LYHLERYGLRFYFRPKFPFRGGFGRLTHFPHLASLTLAETSVYQRVTSGGFSDLLEDGAPALPVIARRCWSFTDSKVIVALGELRVCEGRHG